MTELDHSANAVFDRSLTRGAIDLADLWTAGGRVVADMLPVGL